MVAQAAAVAARVASTGGTRLVSVLAAAGARATFQRRVRVAPASEIGIDPGCAQLLHVARLYRLVLQRLPDRDGLRHHVALLAGGSTLAELASSLLSTSRSASGRREDAARVLWTRAGGAGGFEAAWRAASGLPDFVAKLVRHPIRRDATLLSALFPDGVDPELADVGPAWAYRLWAAEIDQGLDRLARRAMPWLRLLGPRITLTLAVDPNTNVSALDATLAGMSRQIYGRWRVHLRGTAPPGWSPPADLRIVWRSGGSARAGVLSRPLLRGALQPGDVPAPSCLAMFALASLRRPRVSRWSCDEDRIDGDGVRAHPRLHRDGGLVLLRGQARQVRAAERHLPAVLLHRCAGRSAAVADWALPDQTPPTASLVIVTRDRPALLRRCLDSIRATTGAAGTACAPEIVIVDNGTEDPQALRILDRCVAEGCTVLRRPGAFNWSALCNAGVRASTSVVAVLMNNDVECIETDWLPALLAACRDPAVGVVGARLLYEDGRVQHNGVVVGPGPVAAHRLDDADASAAPTRAVSAVTGACMAFRRTVFERLGGLEERLPVTWNDLDFCLRAREIGFDVRVATACVLRHDELGTRTPDTAPENCAQLELTKAFVARRHRRALRRDRLLHPFLLFSSGARCLDPAAPGRIGRFLDKGGID